MGRLRRLDDSPDNHERWLLTYADLITLLLAFFIIMYSMSRMDAGKFDRVAKALHGILRGNASIVAEKDALDDGHLEGGGPLKIGRLRLMETQLREAVAQAGMEEQIEVTIDERGLVVHVTESILFDEASAELKEDAYPALRLVAEALRDVGNNVRIEGHTDSRPINTPRFPSNWELSTARAATVVRYFINKHDWSPHHISALGYGEFRPLVPNDSPENMAKNRRVDVVVLAPNLAVSEPALLPRAEVDSLLQEVLDSVPR